MTDELYDYFGGNASKKVEPIEDDDLDLETEAESQDEVLNEVEDEESAVRSETQLESAMVEEEPEAETRKAGHWDFLANMLGISSPKPTVPKTKPVERKPAAPKSHSSVKDKPVVQETEVKATPVTKNAEHDRKQDSQKVTGANKSSKADFLGFEAIPSPEDSTVLPTMFSAPKEELAAEATEATDDLIGWNPLPRKSFMVESSQSAEDSAEPDVEIPYEDDYEEVEALDGEEFVEFEIEELDVSPRDENEDAAHGRRRRKPSGTGGDRFDSGERQRADRPSSSRSRSTRSRSGEGRSDSEPVQSDRGPRRESGDRDKATSDESRSGRRPRRSRGGRGEKASREERPRHDARSEELTTEKNDRLDRDELRDETSVFGAGLIDVDWEADLEDSNESEVSGSGRTKASPADESRSEGTGSGRKRRRRRGSKSRKDRGAEESRAVDSDSGFGAGLRDDMTDFDSGAGVDSFDDSLDVEDGLDSEETGTDRDDVVDVRPRKREGSRRPNRSTRTRARVNDDDRDDGVDDLPEDDRQRAKVPTWDETITVLVDSNIKNHKKNGGPRRSGGGGNRGRSGGGDRSRDAGGSSSRGDRSGGNRGGGRSEGGDRGRR